VLSLLLFQCGYFVFARSARLPMFQRVALILADSGPGAAKNSILEINGVVKDFRRRRAQYLDG